jgi:starch phosphorylase
MDLWMNTPRRPWEASGTSGMKVLVNGGLNVSELDGWWAEAYAPDVGWAIGDGQDRGYDPAWDAVEAGELYTLLEKEIIPEFYDRDERGIPQRWVMRIRESMARLTPKFSTNRVVRQYTEEHYLRLAPAFCSRAADEGRAGAELLRWQREMARRWHQVRFQSVSIDMREGKYFYGVRLHLGDIDPNDLLVEIYADPAHGDDPVRAPMFLEGRVGPGVYDYTGAVPADRPADYYSPRVIPRKSGVLVPLETALIAWQK